MDSKVIKIGLAVALGLALWAGLSFGARYAYARYLASKDSAQ